MIKKLLLGSTAIILVIAVLLAVTPLMLLADSGFTGDEALLTTTLGDLNGDDRVTARDRIILARYLAGWSGYGEKYNIGNADIDMNGKVENDDLVILKRYVAGWKDYGSYFEKPSEETEIWVSAERTFTSASTYASPFDDVTLDAVFTSPSGVAYTVPAFWNGGNEWCVRFAPNERGVWQYKTVGSDDPGLIASGRFVCTEYTGDLDIYKHGFVKAAKGTKYLMYDDGTPFFYLGDTHWTMASEELDTAGNNAAGVSTDSHFKYIVDRRAEQGFTVYQSETMSCGYWLYDGFQQFDIAAFEKLDRYFGYIAEKGLVHANAQLFFANEVSERSYSNEYLDKLARYWVARFASYPVMWTTAQEADDDFLGELDRDNNPWKTVANAINKYDYYAHPLSCHTEHNITAATSAFKDNVNGYNWIAWQGLIYKTKAWNYSNVRTNYSCDLPVVLYEGYYENLWTNELGARIQGYAAFLNGMCGYGYGVGDIWYYKSSYDMNTDSERDGIIITKEEKDVKWGNTVNNANSVKLGYMKKFFTSFDWYELEPCFDDSNCFTIDNARTLATGAHIGVDRFLVYVYNTNTDARITVKGLQNGTDYSAYWFDCNTGEYILIEKNFSFDGTYSVSQKPSNGDYVLEIVRSGAGQGFAGEENEF